MEKISKQCRIGFLSTIVWGLVAHGVMLINKISWHDDVSQWFGIGTTYLSGRWMLEVMKTCEEYLFGASMFSTPLFNGIISILCIGVVVGLIIELFGLESEFACISLAGIMVTFPVVTSMFGFMYTAAAYMVGLMLGVIGAYLICKYKNKKTYIFGLILCSICVATYQAFIPVIISVFIIYIIKNDISYPKTKIIDMLKEIGYYVASCLGFMCIYFIINKFVLEYYNATLLDYKGISGFGVTSLNGYFERIISAYKDFLMPAQNTSANMYSLGSEMIYQIILFILVICTVYWLCNIYKENIKRGLYLTGAVCVLPLATNFIYVMCGSDQVHSLMVYGKVFTIVYLIVILELIYKNNHNGKKVAKVGMILVLMMSVFYAKYANVCYLKAEVMQTQTIHYFSTMVTRIKSIEGYKDELPVVFVNATGKKDLTLAQNEEFEVINLTPYSVESDDLINNYVWNQYMNNWLGYNPEVKDENVLKDNAEVEKMPAYPDDGSIRIVDGMIVIKY